MGLVFGGNQAPGVLSPCRFLDPVLSQGTAFVFSSVCVSAPLPLQINHLSPLLLVTHAYPALLLGPRLMHTPQVGFAEALG